VIILRKNFKSAKIDISPDTTDAKEEVCVDLSVGESYMEAGDSEVLTLKTIYRLKPSGCIVVRTKECITVPNNIFGFLCSKGSLAARGLLVPNTKIDPMFSGPLDVAIYNAGNSALEIKSGMKFCSIAFQQMTDPIQSGIPRGGPRISNDRANKMITFLIENRTLLITSAVTIIISLAGAALATAITIKMMSN
jgi:deoxycytidine triphosphate deaminase